MGFDTHSQFLGVPAGIPQGTKIGPCLFLTMINDLHITISPNYLMWKFADHTTISEVIPKLGVSTIQDSISQAADWSEVNKFQLNASKCKELQINFTKTPRMEDHITIDNDQSFQVVQSAKILGVTISDNPKWNAHAENITTKASRLLYLIKQLKRADVDMVSLVQFYCSCIRPILEYACRVFYHNNIHEKITRF